MSASRVYLDYNASAPIRPPVIDAVADALRLGGNPSSVHHEGRRLRGLIEKARQAVADLVGAAPEEVFFTSGGTEANNWALRAADRPALVSAIEHASVLEPARARLAGIIPVSRDGLVEEEAAVRQLAAAGAPVVLSVMLANNETGVIQPVRRLAELGHEHGALVHCDAVQAAGKMAVDFAALGVDMMSLSAHKLGGPPGVGALIIRAGLDLPALLLGGGQERRRRAGTEAAATIIGFGVAAELAGEGLARLAPLADWRDWMEYHLKLAAPGVRFFGARAPRLGNSSAILMPGVSAQTQLMALDLEGLALSAGAACSSGKVAASAVLRAMGADADEAANTLRFSMGWNSARSDVERFVEAWCVLYDRLAQP